MEVLEPQMAVDIEVIAEKLCERQQDVIFLGDGVPVFKDKLCNGLMDKLHDCGKEFYFAPAHVNKQRAAQLVHWPSVIWKRVRQRPQKSISRNI